MKVGDRWGRMRCLEIISVREERQFDGGTDSYPVVGYRCVCDCGVEVERKAKEFRKREYRDCGCGIAKDDGAKVLMSITVPLSVRNLVVDWARANTNGNVSVAFTELVRNALVESTSTKDAKWGEA